MRNYTLKKIKKLQKNKKMQKFLISIVFCWNILYNIVQNKEEIVTNLKSEQIKKDFQIQIDYDQKLSISKIMEKLKQILGQENCTIEKVLNKKVLIYKHGQKKEILLVAAITYLGGNGQHPIFKKRMQLKKWYKDIVEYYKNEINANVRFIGLYHYEGNIVLADFIKDTYINKKMNSSAAHVYTNDLYQAMKDGIFKRVDRNKNEVVTIKYENFKKYLDNRLTTENDLLAIFKKFNEEFEFGTLITAKKAITEMYEAGWSKWKETEWPGWYLEYRFNAFIKKYMLENKAKYVGSSNKGKGELDFDVWFDEDNFYGDLKASDIAKKEAPGNDQENFLQCIDKYEKFWYIIYEHETIKDSEENNYEATRFRTNFIKEKGAWPRNKEWDELSYCKRMKNSVKFTKMSIIELNKINYREVLSDFNQGRQPNGDARRVKFKITKNNIDNFIVFQFGI